MPLSHKSFNHSRPIEYERGIFLIILARQSLETWMGPNSTGGDFLEFKRSQGYDVDLVSLDDLGINTNSGLKGYLQNYKNNNPMLEYVLLKGVNDSINDAEILASYANRLRCKVNVIPFNDIGNEFSRPDDQTINRFIDVLHKNQKHYQTLVRWSKGVDIDAACGQLSTKHND